MPITANPAAPPKTTRKASPAQSPGLTANITPLAGRSKERAEGLEGWLQVASIVCISRGWHADAGAIGIHGTKLAEETARTAENAEPLGKVLDFLAMSGPYAALMGAALPFVAQILMNHHVIPEAMALEGVVPPAMLEAQVKAELAEVQLSALKAQQDAETRLSEARAAMNGAPAE
jgi:hypothetical protein